MREKIQIELFLLCYNEEKMILHTLNYYSKFCSKITIIVTKTVKKIRVTSKTTRRRPKKMKERIRVKRTQVTKSNNLDKIPKRFYSLKFRVESTKESKPHTHQVKAD